MGARWRVAACAVLWALLHSSFARAQTADVTELVAAGERARAAGQYGFAIQAFKQAHDRAPSAALLLAIADAYHRRFAVERGAFARMQAIAYFRDYLAAHPAAHRAQRVLAELEADAVAIDDELLARATAAENGTARIAVTSSVMGAVVRLDGQVRKWPLFATISPGKHRLVVTAPGYQRSERKISVVSGLVHVVDVKLSPVPAKLTVSSSVGARVHVDGRFVGVAPMPEPLAIEPGAHTVVVTLNGHDAHAEDIVVGRGSSHALDADLSVTGQRVAAGFLVGLGAAGVAAGIAFGVASTVDTMAAGDAADFTEIRRLEERSDDWRVVSGVAVGVGLGFFLAGGALFIFDEPEVSVEASGPGLGGATVTVRF